MTQSSHILIRNVSHGFTSGKGILPVLSNITLDIRPGEFVSIVGPSGCGKTTLLKLIGGLIAPGSGSVEIDGAPPQEAQRRKGIGFVFQEGGLLPWRTVVQNIRLPLEIGPPNGGGLDPHEVLHMVGLADFSHYYPHQLSGGMKQRVALARALVVSPTVLLMDEPLAALDEITRASMRYELTRVLERYRKTVVFVTHSISEAVILSDRVVVMSARPGRIVGQAAIELPRPRHEDMEATSRFLDYVCHVKNSLALAA